MTDSILAAKTFHWDMAHRLGDGYTSRCRHLHGHRYTAEVAIESDGLDSHGMVMDFGEIAAVCDGWIQANLDHATLVCERDQGLLDFLRTEENRHVVVGFNTTAECIVTWLANVLQDELDAHAHLAARSVRIVRIRLHETPRSYAEWRRT